MAGIDHLRAGHGARKQKGLTVQHPPSLVCKTSSWHPPKRAVIPHGAPPLLFSKINGGKAFYLSRKEGQATHMAAGTSHPTITFFLGCIFLLTSWELKREEKKSCCGHHQRSAEYSHFSHVSNGGKAGGRGKAMLWPPSPRHRASLGI